MNTQHIHIKLHKNGTTPYLTEYLPQIPSNTILCKTLTGLGATYSEIKALRHSIIIEPNTPPIHGKAKASEHKNDNVFPVLKGKTVDDVIGYIVKTLESKDKKYLKFVTTPESYHKVKEAFEEMQLDIHMCFLLFDECQKPIQDSDYRPDILAPFDDFFDFPNKAMVSATPIIPSDPRFADFTLLEIVPEYDYREKIALVYTNNVISALRTTIKRIEESRESERPIMIFLNKTDFIYQIITSMGIEEDSTVLCSENSVDKLKAMKFRQVYSEWNIKHKRKYIFLTSRFYASLDIIMDEKPDIIFVSVPFYAPYTIFDPTVDIVQAIGRTRNGHSQCYHIVEFDKNIEVLNEGEARAIVLGHRTAYETIKRLRDNEPNVRVREGFQNALDNMEYNKFLRDGEESQFLVDNYINDVVTLSLYHDKDALYGFYTSPEMKKRYSTVELINGWNDDMSTEDRLTLQNANMSQKEKIRKVVELLEVLDASSSEHASIEREQLRKDPTYGIMVEAYEKLGKPTLEELKYSLIKIRERLILKDNKDKMSAATTLALVKNAFVLGRTYSGKYIRNELSRIFNTVGIVRDSRVTVDDISQYFEYIDTRTRNQRQYRIVRCKV